MPQSAVVSQPRKYRKAVKQRRFHPINGGRHLVEVSQEEWEMACRLADQMQPPMIPSQLIRWLFDEGLKREWEAAIAAGAITVEKP